MSNTLSWGNLGDWQFRREFGGHMTIALKKPLGVSVYVRITPDHDTKITDYDCYSEEQIKAWRNNEWGFVALEISFAVAGERVGHTERVGGVEDFGTSDGDKYIARCALDYLDLVSVHKQLTRNLCIVTELLAELEGKATA